MSVFAFRNGPSFRGADPTEQMQAAMDMPMSLTATLGDQFKGGILDSLGLGTAVRQATLPDEAPTAPTLTMQGPEGETITLPDTPQMRRRATVQGIDLQRETQQQLDQRRESAGALDQDQFKVSPYFREGVRWDAGMTEDRASALAEAYDAKRVREHFATKRPIASFIGNLAGQAIDPINYIPVAGPTLRAANVARFGRVAGAALTGSVDAALNTAGASAVTFDTRKSMGDDITWQSTVTDIAMSAMIGGVFGTFGGLVESRRAGRLADSQKQATERLATLKNVQDARIALNGAIDGLARGEDVTIGANAADAVQRLADKSNPVWSPQTFASLDRQDMFGSTSVGRFLDTRPVMVQDAETMLRNQVFAGDPVIAARYQQAETRFQQAQDALAAIEDPLSLRRQSDTLALIDPDSAARLRAVEDELAGNVPAARRSQLEAERDLISQSVAPEVLAKAENDFRIGPSKQAKSARKALATARQEFAKVRTEADKAAERIRATDRVKYQARVDLSPPRPEMPPMGRVEAETRIAKVEDFKAMSEQYRVNADEGSFTEQADVDQIRKEGRLTEADEAELADAQQAFDNGSAYAEALKSVAGCLI